MVCNSKPTQSKKVCIIGAGMAGLAAVYELRREGHDVTVLEQSGDICGQWLYDLRSDGADPLGTTTPVRVHISIYASLRLISPRQTTGFTDFQFSPKNGRDNRLYPGHREMHAFGLMEAVRASLTARKSYQIELFRRFYGFGPKRAQNRAQIHGLSCK
jgi:cation diffusion facilitator CzcD-associated flavoprotein CzcO